MTGKKLIDIILLAVMILATLAVIGLFYWTEKVYKKPPINEEAEKTALMNSVDAKAIPTFFKVDKMTISLIPVNELANARMKYLELEVHFVLFESGDVELIKVYLPVVQDRIIEVASRMSPDELNSLSGKILLEDRLKREINKALKKPVVKNIFFASFIVQL
ncbi:MAG: flagellar basal body-associated FliL family protein [Bdellovibrionales bacterium]|nr:flagellar basal body-associated FliL family protein [Bdellovibrionales bacterium]